MEVLGGERNLPLKKILYLALFLSVIDPKRIGGETYISSPERIILNFGMITTSLF